MRLAYPRQAFQDWVTQQWVILRGRRIDPAAFPWLIGPFGNLNGIGAGFIAQLAEKEGLLVEKTDSLRGLLSSIRELELPEAELARLSPNVTRFYEKTAGYTLDLTVKWNPLFKLFGTLVNKLFSNRINQLNLPIRNGKSTEIIKSEIITLAEPVSKQVKHTVWLRTVEASGQVIYSGVYGTCRLPSGKVCIKAIFPLPKGNATVIMAPSVGKNGELILDASGKQLGDAGFYFQLHDSKGNHWVHFVRPFRDQLIVSAEGDFVLAEQTLTLWQQRVLTFYYRIKPKVEEGGNT